jgi:hypothetical protein
VKEKKQREKRKGGKRKAKKKEKCTKPLKTQVVILKNCN